MSFTHGPDILSADRSGYQTSRTLYIVSVGECENLRASATETTLLAPIQELLEWCIYHGQLHNRYDLDPISRHSFQDRSVGCALFKLQQNQASRTGGTAAHLYPRHLATIRIRVSRGCSADRVIFTVP